MHPRNCFLCDEQLAEHNDSAEHLIPNSIGGRRTTRGFLCTKCNNTSGKTWDAELAKQLNSLSLIHEIKRQRGVVPPSEVRTASGEKLTLRPGGGMTPATPKYSEELVDGKIHISLQARSTKEAKHLLKGIKRKHPTLDMEKALGEMKELAAYPTEQIQLSISLGGKSMECSAVKSAAALAVSAGISARSLGSAKNFMLGTGESCLVYVDEHNFVVDRPPNSILHCVAIQGSSEERLLLGYVEYYGLQRLLICLSTDYSGPDIKQSYAIDPFLGKELPIIVNIPFSRNAVEALLKASSKPNQEALKATLRATLEPVILRANDRERERVLHEAVEYAFMNCGAAIGEQLTEDHINKLTGLMMEKLTPYLIHQIRLSRKEKGPE